MEAGTTHPCEGWETSICAYPHRRGSHTPELLHALRGSLFSFYTKDIKAKTHLYFNFPPVSAWLVDKERERHWGKDCTASKESVTSNCQVYSIPGCLVFIFQVPGLRGHNWLPLVFWAMQGEAGGGCSGGRGRSEKHLLSQGKSALCCAGEDIILLILWMVLGKEAAEHTRLNILTSTCKMLIGCTGLFFNRSLFKWDLKL